jgi:TRAP-type C4-dicarboxylate transport system substrate-binding protein
MSGKIKSSGSRAWLRVVVAAAMLGIAVPVLSAATVIKLATQAPANSSWYKALTDMGEAWRKATNGNLTLTIFAGGQQGDEASQVRMMRPGIGTIQASLLTAGGMALIDDTFNVFNMPFFFADDAEELAVQQKLEPILAQKAQAKGYHVLAWSTGGWIELFSKQPIKTLAELKASKLYTSKGDDRMVQWFAGNGFHPVALLPADIPAQLKLGTGLINAAPSTPYLAATLGFFRDAPYMLDLHVAPLVGALVMSGDAWGKLTPDEQKVVLDGAKTFDARMRTEAPRQDSDSLTQMTQRGLNVTKLDAKADAEFHTAADQMIAKMRGGMVPADIFDAAVAARDAYRKSKGK